MNNKRLTVFNITFIAMMAAMVYVVTLFRFPLMGSKVHFANAVCLLAGILLGPLQGGLAAGIGSALYDAVAGYDIINVAITLVSKFAMAWVCGLLIHPARQPHRLDRTALACVLGALTYVGLYMLKSWLFKLYVGPVPVDTIPGILVAKLIPSLINAAFAIVVAPIFYHAVLPALKSIGVYRELEYGK